MKKILKSLLECSLVTGVGGVLASVLDATALHALTPQAGLGLLFVSVVAILVGGCLVFFPGDRRATIVSVRHLPRRRV